MKVLNWSISLCKQQIDRYVMIVKGIDSIIFLLRVNKQHETKCNKLTFEVDQLITWTKQSKIKCTQKMIWNYKCSKMKYFIKKVKIIMYFFIIHPFKILFFLCNFYNGWIFNQDVTIERGVGQDWLYCRVPPGAL